MKRLLVALLAACILTSSLAGCTSSGDTGSNTDTSSTDTSTTTDGGEDGNTLDVNEDGTVNNPEDVEIDENKLVFWSLFSGGDGEFMDKMVTDYNASSPTKEVQTVLLVWGDYYTKLMTAVSANRGPDIGVSHASRLPELSEQGVIIAIDDIAQEVGVDFSKYGSNAVSGSTIDGQMYAVPLDTHAEILYYNTDLLAEAGIPLEADGSVKIDSWDHFKELLVQTQAVVGDGSALSLGQSGDDPWRVWWAAYFGMGGTPILSDDGTEVTMDTDIAIAAAEAVHSLYTEGLIKPGIEDHQKYFQGGSAAFEFGGTWAVGVYEGTSGFNYGGMAFPKFFDKKASYADLHTMILPTSKSRTDEETVAAMEFIQYITGEGTETWAESGQIVSNLDVYNSDLFNSLPNRAIYKEAADDAELPFISSVYGAMKTEMITALDSLWVDQVDAATAIDTMIAGLESNL